MVVHAYTVACRTSPPLAGIFRLRGNPCLGSALRDYMLTRSLGIPERGQYHRGLQNFATARRDLPIAGQPLSRLCAA